MTWWASALRECSTLGEVRCLHSRIGSEKLRGRTLLGNLLVQMYGKHGSFDDALLAFEDTCERNIFSWNILFKASSQNGGADCKFLFDRMPARDAVSWNTMLQELCNSGDLLGAKWCFDDMPQRGVVSWTSMVAAIAKSFSVNSAIDWFSRMPQRDAAAWNAMISGSAESGDLHSALHFFTQMPQRDVISWNSLLQAASEVEEQAWVLEAMPEHSAITWTTMLVAYAATGHTQDAAHAFAWMPHRTSVSWNAMIAAFCRSGCVEEARIVFDRAPEQSLSSSNAIVGAFAQLGELHRALDLFTAMQTRDVVTWTILLTAFPHGGGSLDAARQIFESMPQHSVVTWNAMIQAVAQLGESVTGACVLFDSVPERDLVSWNLLIQAFAGHRDSDAARAVFDAMPQQDLKSWGILMNAYVEARELKQAEELLQEAPCESIVLGNTMILGYAAAGAETCEAKRLFLGMQSRDSGTWNAMLQACNELEEAKQVFDRMPLRDLVSWTAMVNCCAESRAVEEAKSLFDRMPQCDVVPWTAIVVGYAQDERIEEARAIFEKMPQRDMASWNAMVWAYAQSGDLQEARTMVEQMPSPTPDAWNALLGSAESSETIVLFGRMEIEGVMPNAAAFKLVIAACARLASFKLGSLLHESILEQQLQEVLAAALINFYGCCGCVDAARSIFENLGLGLGLQRSSIDAWGAMAGALAWNGRADESAAILRSMALAGFAPDASDFLSIFTACSHAGMIDRGWECFVSMANDFGLEASYQHYICLVDQLGRCGLVAEAVEVIEGMPFQGDEVAWTTLLGACKTHGDACRAKDAASTLAAMNPGNDVPYTMLHATVASTCL